MSDYSIPELPSDEELGITGEDAEAPEAEAPAAEAPSKKEKRRQARGAGGADGEPPPPPPARPWRGPLTLVVLVVLGYLASIGRALPEPGPLDAPDTAFSSGRAILDLQSVAERAHPTGSPDHARVRGMLVERLRGLGLAPEVQTATSLHRTGDTLEAVTVRNVLARIPGTASTGAILLMAHYDGAGISRAAADDGSGVVAILEVLRALKAGPPLKNDVLVLISDGEELGLMGAQAFVDQHPWMADVKVALNVEMRGGGGPSIMFQTGAENGWIVRAMAAGDPRPFANSAGLEVYRRMPNGTDFTPLEQAGVQGLDFAGIDHADVYHQAYDDPGHFDERTLQHEGLHLLGIVRELGGRDLADVDAPDKAYLTLPWVGLIAYPAFLGWALAGVLLVGFALVIVLTRRRGGVVPGLLGGLVIAVAGVGGTAAAAWFLMRWLHGRQPAYGALVGSAFHVEAWYVGAIAAFAVAVVTFLLGLARRWMGLGSLALGALVLPLLGALVLPGVAPLAAPDLQWPVLFALAGAALVAGVGRSRRPGIVSWLLLLVLAAPILAVTVPVSQLVWLALSLRSAVVVAAVIATAVVLLLPVLDTLREPGRLWVPVMSILLAAAFTGVGLLNARPSATRPAPSTLVYAMDHDAGTALWASVEGPGDAWVRNRVGPLGSVQPLDGYLMGDLRYETARAPLVDAAPPEVTVEEVGMAGASGAAAGAAGAAPTSPAPTAGAPGTVPGGPLPAPGTARRRVLVRVRSAIGAEMVAVRLPEHADAFLRSVDGRPVPQAAGGAGASSDGGETAGSGRVTTLEHWGIPADSAGVLLELDVGPGLDTLDLGLVEHHLRPEELVGERFFLRPPALAPDVVTKSDRAVLRSTVRVVLGAGGGTVIPGGRGRAGNGPEAPGAGGAVPGGGAPGGAAPAGEGAAPGGGAAAPGGAGTPGGSLPRDSVAGSV